MLIEVSQSSVIDVYQMLVGLVTPRPIAWVTTMSKTGVVNLAPFSFFNVFGANPPVVVFSPTLKRDGTKKDTLLHIEATREFVINASTEQYAEKVNQSSASLPPEESEVAWIGMDTTPSIHVRPPRLSGVPFAIECRLLEIKSYGNGPIAPNLVIGEVVTIHVDDAVLGKDGHPDPRKLKAVARLGSEYWCRTQDLFEFSRPK